MKDKIIIGVATFAGREKALAKMLESIEKQTIQVDLIFIYDNEHSPDLTDNGKFRYLEKITEPSYYFSMDDDLYYSKTYIEDMIKAIDEYQTIVTHHGRRLRGPGRNYYFGHKQFTCLDHNGPLKTIDVAGTGVTAFHTSYFNPVDIWKSEDKKMSDCVFSLEAAKQGKIITVLPHERGYITQLEVDAATSCYETQRDNPVRQSWYADEICKIKNIENPKK